MNTSGTGSTKLRLDLLYRLSQAFNSTLDLDEVLNRVMDEVIEVMRAERGFVMLREADGRLSFRVARGLDQRTLEESESAISMSVVRSVARDGQAVLTSDAQVDSRFMGRQSVRMHGLRSVLCVPLGYKEQVSGVIYVDNRLQTGIFTQADLELLEAIASNAAVAIENARLYQVAVEKGRLERELQMAYQVQASLLPQEMPLWTGWEFGTRWQPAREVAGDYYDFFEVEGQGLGVVIADVADKGMPAALFMASSRSIVRASLSRASSPVEGLVHANQLICQESSGGMFLTLFYLLIEPETGRARYINAGHNPPWLFRARQAHVSPLKRTGMALGVISDAPYEERTETLEPGDFIFMYTDGVTDAIDERGRNYGVERLEKVVCALHKSSCEELLEALERSIRGFTGASIPYDDITVLMVKRNPDQNVS